MAGGWWCTEQELLIHQRRLRQLVLHPTTSGQPQPRDMVGLDWSYAAWLQPHGTQGSITQTPHHAWWPDSTPSVPLHGHQMDS